MNQQEMDTLDAYVKSHDPKFVPEVTLGKWGVRKRYDRELRYLSSKLPDYANTPVMYRGQLWDMLDFTKMDEAALKPKLKNDLTVKNIFRGTGKKANYLDFEEQRTHTPEIWEMASRMNRSCTNKLLALTATTELAKKSFMLAAQEQQKHATFSKMNVEGMHFIWGGTLKDQP